MKVIGVLLSIVLVVAIFFGLAYMNYAGYAFFAPKYTAVDNKVFHESQQYNDGMQRDLENLRMQYLTGDASTKAVLRPTIIHRFSIYDKSRLSPDLAEFYSQVEGGN